MPYEHNGKIYTRVSEVANLDTDFSQIPPNILARKQDIGTRTHDAIARGVVPDADADIRGYYDSWSLWLQCVEGHVIERETRYYCDELMLTGQIDAIVDINQDDIPVLIDCKTSAVASPDAWIMQAHMYAYLVSKHRRINDRYLWLQLSPAGKIPRVHAYYYDNNIFNKCLVYLDRIRENNLRLH